MTELDSEELLVMIFTIYVAIVYGTCFFGVSNSFFKRY